MSLSFKTQIQVEGLNLCRAVCELENLGFELSDIRFLNKKSITFGEESIVNTYYDYEMYEGEIVLMPFNLNYGIKDYEIRYADFKMHDIKGDNIELLSFDLVYSN